MFGDQLILSDVIAITVIGMGIVFLILLLLAFIVSLFKFIPNNDRPVSTLAVQPSNVQVMENISPLYRAVIIASILEYENITNKKNYVRITNIRKIS